MTCWNQVNSHVNSTFWHKWLALFTNRWTFLHVKLTVLNVIEVHSYVTVFFTYGWEKCKFHIPTHFHHMSLYFYMQILMCQDKILSNVNWTFSEVIVFFHTCVRISTCRNQRPLCCPADLHISYQMSTRRTDQDFHGSKLLKGGLYF